MKRQIKEKKLAALIVAAGFSSRMQKFKPLLPMHTSTVIECTIDAFLGAGVTDVFVVIGHNADLIRPVLEKKNIRWVYNPNYEEGMYTSIKVGVEEIGSDYDGFFMMPADIPFVKSETIRLVGDAFNPSDHSVVYPVFDGRRGHPPVIAMGLSHDILTYDGTGGLKTLLGRYAESAFHLDVSDEGILIDLDTQETYEKWRNITL